MNLLPLVTIGMPVRNGAEFLAAALDSVLGQSYPNLEIIISDNCSDDQTSAIIQTYLVRDPRLVYVRQERPLTAIENFRFVLDHAQGEFFMWAAHDDLHSADYVETLVSELLNNPIVLLAFGDLLIISAPDGCAVLKSYDFSTEGLSWIARMRKAAFTQCFHIYGVWRIQELRRIPLPTNLWWPDLPIMMAAAKLGSFRYVAGAQFVYYETPKSNLQRAQYQNYKARFNLLLSVGGLVVAGYSVVSAVGGPVSGMWSAWLLIEKQLRELPGFVGRRLLAVATCKWCFRDQ